MQQPEVEKVQVAGEGLSNHRPLGPECKSTSPGAVMSFLARPESDLSGGLATCTKAASSPRAGPSSPGAELHEEDRSLV